MVSGLPPKTAPPFLCRGPPCVFYRFVRPILARALTLIYISHSFLRTGGPFVFDPLEWTSKAVNLRKCTFLKPAIVRHCFFCACSFSALFSTSLCSWLPPRLSGHRSRMPFDPAIRAPYPEPRPGGRPRGHGKAHFTSQSLIWWLPSPS